MSLDKKKDTSKNYKWSSLFCSFCLQISGGLSKVNVATLYDWCKKNGVPAKAKDKKDDLVTKVLIKLNLFVANEP